MHNVSVKDATTGVELMKYKLMPKSKRKIERFLAAEHGPGTYRLGWYENGLPKQKTFHVYEDATGERKQALGYIQGGGRRTAYDNKLEELSEKIDRVAQAVAGWEDDDDEDDDDEDEAPQPSAGDAFLNKLASVGSDPKFQKLISGIMSARSTDEVTVVVNQCMAEQPGIIPELLFRVLL